MGVVEMHIVLCGVQNSANGIEIVLWVEPLMQIIDAGHVVP